jgi:hypothetical protein
MKYLTIFILILFTNLYPAGTKLIDYGFEDYTGNVETTPGYIFTASALSYWQNHLDGTEPVSNCSGYTAYEGTYFERKEWLTSYNACIGSTPSTNLAQDMHTDTLVIRFAFRGSSSWNSNGLNILKFCRTTGTGGGDIIDSYFPEAGGNQFGIQTAAGNGWHYWNAPTNITDGQWHTWTERIVLLNHTNSSPNLRLDIWIDDWDMVGSADLANFTTQRDFGSGFMVICLGQNWGASYPSTSCWVDYDKIEVWDGMPNTNPDPPPSQVQGIQVTAQ